MCDLGIIHIVDPDVMLNLKDNPQRHIVLSKIDENRYKKTMASLP